MAPSARRMKKKEEKRRMLRMCQVLEQRTRIIDEHDLSGNEITPHLPYTRCPLAPSTSDSWSNSRSKESLTPHFKLTWCSRHFRSNSTHVRKTDATTRTQVQRKGNFDPDASNGSRLAMSGGSRSRANSLIATRVLVNARPGSRQYCLVVTGSGLGIFRA